MTAAAIRIFLLLPEPSAASSSSAPKEGLLPGIAAPNVGKLASSRSTGAITAFFSTGAGEISFAGAGAEAAPLELADVEPEFLNSVAAAGIADSTTRACELAGAEDSVNTVFLTSGTAAIGLALASVEAAIAGSADSNTEGS